MKPTMKFITTLILLTFVSLPAFAWDNDPIDQAWRSNDLEALQQMAQGDDFSALYSHYRIALIAQEQGNKKLANQSLKVVLDKLSDHYQTADEAALYYNCIGLSIALKPWTAAFAVKKADKALNYSESLSTDHPPTLVAKGVGLFNRPSFVGGDKAQALVYFDQALMLYQLEEAWAYEDAWLWKIKALIKTDQPVLAAEQQRLLLQQFPDFIAAKELTF